MRFPHMPPNPVWPPLWVSPQGNRHGPGSPRKYARMLIKMTGHVSGILQELRRLFRECSLRRFDAGFRFSLRKKKLNRGLIFGVLFTKPVWSEILGPVRGRTLSRLLPRRTRFVKSRNAIRRVCMSDVYAFLIWEVALRICKMSRIPRRIQILVLMRNGRSMIPKNTWAYRRMFLFLFRVPFRKILLFSVSVREILWAPPRLKPLP